MRILHVTPFFAPDWGYGGMVRASAALCRALALRGHEVTVATMRYGRRYPIEEYRDGVRVVRFDGPDFLKRRLLPWSRRLAPFLQTLSSAIDIAHLHGHRSGLAWSAARVLHRGRVPFVLATHGTYPHHGQHRIAKTVFDRMGGAAIVYRAAALLALSQAEACDLPRAARVVPNGVERCGEGAMARVDTQVPDRPDTKRLLFVGTDRFRRKRADLLPRLLAALPGVDLGMVGVFGDGFQRRFTDFGDRVRFLGVLSGDSLALAYASADLLVHPAVAEAFGLVPFEAALHGTASVVAGDHGCGEWYGRAGGCTVPPEDFDRMVTAIRARLTDPQIGTREAAAVAAFAQQTLTWERVAAAIEGIYEDVLRKATSVMRLSG